MQRFSAVGLSIVAFNLLCMLRQADANCECDFIQDLSRSVDSRSRWTCHPRDAAAAGELKPWQKKQWVMAPTSSAEFVAAMEDVLEVYARAPDAASPLVCLDECTKELTREVRVPQAAVPGRAAREDYEYERNG